MSLRYFFESRPDLPVVAAGSLLEFTLAESGVSMPVGRIHYHFLGPLSFAEFLAALGEDLLLGALHSQGDPSQFSLVAHQRLLEILRTYLLVGGMPEAVARYAETRDLAAAIRVHRSIVNTYVDDFGKYVRGADIERMRRIFEQLPLHLARKVRYNRFHPDWRAADIRRCLDLLQRSGIAVAAVHSDGNGAPLGAEEDPSVYKLFHLDVGLVGTMMGLDPVGLADFATGRFINEGVLAEQFVSQQLLRSKAPDENPRLHYWQREGASRNAEVDFLVQRGSTVIPIEVKSGTSGTLRSLHQFMLKHPDQEALRFDLNPPSLQNIDVQVMSGQEKTTSRYRLRNQPLYLAGS
jgi:predicted AAA+ superfamily ATPase